MAKTKFWESLELKTGKQAFLLLLTISLLWLLTISLSVVFGNNVADILRNISNEPIVFGSLYLLSFFVFRAVLGYLFDERVRRKR